MIDAALSAPAHAVRFTAKTKDDTPLRRRGVSDNQRGSPAPRRPALSNDRARYCQFFRIAILIRRRRGTQMRRLCLLLTCIAATPAAWADDVGRGRTSARYEVASADAPDLTAAARVTLWPRSAQGQASPPPAAPAQAPAAPDVPKTTPSAGLRGACDTRIDGESLRALVWREAQTIGVDPKLGLTILSLESNDGVSLNSGKGARGPMQLLPETAARYGV